jgi:hypothetical protein
MGKRYEQHSDMCGCERCARKADNGDNSPTFDVIDDPDYLDCGCPRGYCDCGDWDDDDWDDDDYDDEEAA